MPKPTTVKRGISKKSHAKGHATPLKLILNRQISQPTACILWGRAAGRCEFPGCNRVLYRSPITTREANIAEKAHIYAFSEKGPRGHRGIGKRKLNTSANLLLVCHDCHVLIDRGDGANQYPVEFLRDVKTKHETRCELATGVDPCLKSHILLFQTAIGQNTAALNFHMAAEALLPQRNPAEPHGISLGTINSSLTERTQTFWLAETENLRSQFERHVRPRLKSKDIEHLSVFAFAPQPLLILLGSLLADITPADVYQRHREPPSWKWPDTVAIQPIRIKEPTNRTGSPALVLSLSATIVPARITRILGEDASIWVVTVDQPHNNLLQSMTMLSEIRTALRSVLDRIKAAHGDLTTLHIFPAAPVAANVELGRVRMPKAEMPWLIYDQVSDRGFIPAITIAQGE